MWFLENFDAILTEKPHFLHRRTYSQIRYCYGKIIGHSSTYSRKMIRICDFFVANTIKQSGVPNHRQINN